MAAPRNIFLVGFMASGKSHVGSLLSQRTGWPLVDSDREIVARSGKSIEQLFETEGEAAFRSLERQIIRELCAGSGKIISVGGGAFVDGENRERMLSGGLVVGLRATPETIHRRVTRRRSDAPVRPLLAGDNPLERIRTLLAQRADAYAQAHHTIETDTQTPEQVAERILGLCPGLSPKTPGGESMADANLAAMVHHAGGSYPVIAGWGVLEELGDRLTDLGIQGPVYIITDDNVMNPYGRRAQRALQRRGIGAHCFIIPPGEPSKTNQLAQAIYEWLVGLRAERGHAILAVGGGVVGDLAGFVAATFLRGVPFVQVPTSMAAMVDASIGGKVAVNLPQGKNLVGAFYQPRAVLADVQALATLGQRELSEGWAEAIKHGLILDPDLVDVFEEHAEALLRMEPEISTEVIRRSMAIKADIVSRDERETLDIRILLNYGHTIGHALEASTEYGRFMHGEGVSIGMMGAARMACQMGMIPQELVERQRVLLERFNLPIRAGGVPVEDLRRAMSLDKKTVGGSNRWVMLEGVGQAVVRRDVPVELVDETIQELVS
ncbi:MAG: 3-dehydroquinate synthase [Dehalococcoidia bacterium]